MVAIGDRHAASGARATHGKRDRRKVRAASDLTESRKSFPDAERI